MAIGCARLATSKNHEVPQDERQCYTTNALKLNVELGCNIAPLLPHFTHLIMYPHPTTFGSHMFKELPQVVRQSICLPTSR